MRPNHQKPGIWAAKRSAHTLAHQLRALASRFVPAATASVSSAAQLSLQQQPASAAPVEYTMFPGHYY